MNYRKITEAELDAAWEKSQVEAQDKHIQRLDNIWQRFKAKLSPLEAVMEASIFRSTSYRVRIDKLPDDAHIDWFGYQPRLFNGSLFLLPKPNLAVDTGLHIAAQRAFGLTAVGSSVADIVDAGGVDNSVTAVSATTTRFDTTGGNRFLTAFEATPTYSAANKRVTALFNITNTDITIVHRRYGLTTDTANADFTLFSMLSGFVLDFNSKAYDITVESQTNFTGS